MASAPSDTPKFRRQKVNSKEFTGQLAKKLDDVIGGKCMGEVGKGASMADDIFKQSKKVVDHMSNQSIYQ